MDSELKNILKTSTILLVENDERIREKFSRLLSIYVSKIYEASNGDIALELYKKLKPSFIITDIEMPHMGGLDLLNILRTEGESVPAIITSAYSNTEYLLDSIKLQLVAYLLKPISQKELLESLESVALILKKRIISSTMEIREDISYNPIQKTVTVDGKISRLTSHENKFFELLLLNRGTVVTKTMVEDKLYVFKEMSDTALKNIVYKLRKKLVQDVIRSVDRLGYMIE